MPGFTEQLSQALSIPVASTMPSNQGSGAGNQATIGPIDMSRFRRVMAHVMLGTAGTSANVQAYFQTSNASGSGFANVATNPQTLTLSTANTEGTIEIRADQLNTNNRYLQLIMLVNTNPANTAATVWAGQSEYSPANQYDYTGLPANRLVT